MSPVDMGEQHPALGAADAAALRQGRAWCVCAGRTEDKVAGGVWGVGVFGVWAHKQVGASVFHL